MTYIDYMDLAVCCSRKAIKLNHSHTKFAGWRRRGCWGTKEVYVLVFQTSNNFLVVDGLVIWLRCLAGKIVVIHVISMWDMQHNLLCNWWFSRLPKFLDWKDIFLITNHFWPLTFSSKLSICSHHPCQLIIHQICRVEEKRVMRDQGDI